MVPIVYNQDVFLGVLNLAPNLVIVVVVVFVRGHIGPPLIGAPGAYSPGAVCVRSVRSFCGRRRIPTRKLLETYSYRSCY